MDSPSAEPTDAETMTYLYDRMDPKLPGAIGAFMLNWNACEAVMTNILSHFMGSHVYAAASGLSNKARTSLLRSYLDNSAASEAASESVRNFVSRYNIITETRNVIVHSMVFPSETGLLLTKRTDDRVTHYDISAEIINDHAKVALELFHNGTNIFEHLRNKTGRPIALPGKFPKASKLAPRSHQEGKT